MSVQVWIGEKPGHPDERRAVFELAQQLQQLEDPYLLLVNFTVGGFNLDLVVLKPEGAFVVELKQCNGRVVGSVNEPWRVIDANGIVKVLNPDRKNPYNQVLDYYYAFSNALNEARLDLFPAQKAHQTDFRTARRVVVIYPELHPNSEVEVDWKVDVIGFDEFVPYLLTERSADIRLTQTEMEQIAQWLGCRPWTEMNRVLVGLETPLSLEALELAPTPPPEGEEAAAEPESGGRSQALRISFLAVLLAGLAVILALARPKAPAVVVSPSVQEGTPPPVVILPGTPLPATPPPLPEGTRARPSPTPQGRLRLEVNETRQGFVPDVGGQVRITLEAVEFQEDAILFHWRFENQGRSYLSFRLDPETVQIRDGVGSRYQVDPQYNSPARVAVQPGGSLPALCVVPRPVNPDALSLRIDLQVPFPATFLVDVPNR